MDDSAQKGKYGMWFLYLLNFAVLGFPILMVGSAKMIKEYKPQYPGQKNSKLWVIGSSGYSTPRSRYSKRHWDAAQKAAIYYFGVWGELALWVGIGCLLLGFKSPLFGTIAGALNSIIFLYIAFGKTENYLIDELE